MISIDAMQPTDRILLQACGDVNPPELLTFGDQVEMTGTHRIDRDLVAGNVEAGDKRVVQGPFAIVLRRPLHGHGHAFGEARMNGAEKLGVGQVLSAMADLNMINFNRIL